MGRSMWSGVRLQRAPHLASFALLHLLIVSVSVAAAMDLRGASATGGAFAAYESVTSSNAGSTELVPSGNGRARFRSSSSSSFSRRMLGVEQKPSRGETGQEEGGEVTDKAAKLESCPELPLELCDFHFQGYDREIPTFQLPENGGEMNGTSSPFVMDARTRRVIEIASSGRGKFLCPREGSRSVGLQFYGAGQKVLVQKFAPPARPRELFESRFVLLPIIYGQLPHESGTPVSFKPGDKNRAVYPESRRCVVFKTGPAPPVSSF